MAANPQLTPRPGCRRLLKTDLPQLQALYRQALAPTARPLLPELQDTLQLGQLWGAGQGGQLGCAGGLLPLAACCRPALAAAPLAPLVQRQGPGPLFLICQLALDPAAAGGPQLLAGLLAALCRQAQLAGAGGLLLALPVKNAPPLAPFFAAGFRLVALRPLLRLCAGYLFTLAPQGDFPYNEKNGPSLQLCPEETRALGCRLEEGWQGVGLSPCGALLLCPPGAGGPPGPAVREG